MRVLGIGNALVDVLAKLPNDDLLNELNISKGSMNLIDESQREIVLEKINSWDLAMTTGGSVGNSTLALRQLGVPVGFIGKVGSDQYGRFYIDEMTLSGVDLHLIYERKFSGTALCLITPDGERTFTTYLGAAADMQKTDLKESVLQRYTHFYVEGYLVQNHELIEGALKMAKQLGLKTALDLASYNIVQEEHDFLNSLVDNYVDILFANEEEATAFTGKSPSEAIHEIAARVEIAVVKEGSKGSWVKKGDLFIHVPCYQVIKPVDTTAAGDYYAAGFLAGLQKGLSLDKCAEVGSLLSYHIIQVVGTKLNDSVWDDIREKINQI